MNGFFNVLKSTSMTSSDVVVKLRGILRSRTGVRFKVGHLGTLDPGGSGVLPIAVGNAAKLFNYFIDKTKKYRACFTLGVATDTLDAYGKITARGDEVTDVKRVESAARALVGTYGQLPPDYSAKSVGGVRAYDLARQGKSFELSARIVTVYEMTLVEAHGHDFTFDITCSGGTYVRSICRDLAAQLGTVGYMRYIIRLQSGEFVLSDSKTLGEIERDITAGFVPLERWAASLPEYSIAEAYRVPLLNGLSYSVDNMPLPLYRVFVGDEPYAIGCAKDGRLKIVCRL